MFVSPNLHKHPLPSEVAAIETIWKPPGNLNEFLWIGQTWHMHFAPLTPRRLAANPQSFQGGPRGESPTARYRKANRPNSGLSTMTADVVSGRFAGYYLKESILWLTSKLQSKHCLRHSSTSCCGTWLNRCKNTVRQSGICSGWPPRGGKSRNWKSTMPATPSETLPGRDVFRAVLFSYS